MHFYGATGPEGPIAQPTGPLSGTVDSCGGVRLPDYFLTWWAELNVNPVTANLTYVAWRIGGPDGATRFRAAIHDAATRHEVLASRVVERDDSLYLEHSSEWALAELAAAGPTCLESVIWTPLARGAVFRPFVVERSATDTLCGFVAHHGVVDYYGSQILARQIRNRLLGAPVDSSRAAPQYRDYIRAMSDWMLGAEAERRLEYWRHSMQDAPETCLAKAAPIDPAATVPLQRIEFELSPALRDGLASAARACQSTLALTIMTVNHIALAAALDQLDVIATVLISGRDTPELLDLVGNTADCFPLRASVDPQALFPAFVRQIQQTFWLGCRQRVKWERVLGVMREVRASVVAPTFNFIIDPECAGQPQAVRGRKSDLSLERIFAGRPPEFGSAGFHPSHDTNLFDTGRMIYVEVKYTPARHESRTIETFADRLLRSLTAIAHDPFVSVAELMWI